MTRQETLATLEDYDFRAYDRGASDRSSVPLGNGVVGVNVWVTRDGRIRMYVARSDAVTELDRFVKLGEVSLSFEPNVLADAGQYSLRLSLAEGMALVSTERAKVKVLVDALSPTVYVTGEFSEQVVVRSVYTTWRTDSRAPGSDSVVGAFSECGVEESADIVEARDGGILFYHRNTDSVIPFHASQQAMGHAMNEVPDTISGRIFGGYLALSGAAADDDRTLVSSRPRESLELTLTTASEQEPSETKWIDRLIDEHRTLAPAADAIRRTATWWGDYWSQSPLFASGDRVGAPLTSAAFDNLAKEPRCRRDVPDSRVTEAYVLSRYLIAAGRGDAFPILFNGALFNVMPGAGKHYDVATLSEVCTVRAAGEPDLEINPDERTWAHMQLWQNLRLPYHSFLAEGEFHRLHSLFAYFGRFTGLSRERARVYHRAKGQHSTEITTSFGLMPASVYGLDRTGLEDGYAANRAGGAVDVSPGLELAAMMLDYFDYTGDVSFLCDELVPYARELLTYVETRFPDRDRGRIIIGPLHAVETYYDTIDPMPTVAGLHAVVGRLFETYEVEKEDRRYLEQFHQRLPELPTEAVNGRRLLAPARIYDPERNNVETPRTYAVFPFRLFGQGKPNLELAIESFHHALEVAGSAQPFRLGMRPDYPSYSGWQQAGMVAALLGLSREAKDIIENNCALSNPGYWFPAMWGPTYDAVPDIDHTANIVTTLQLMAFQAEARQIHVLPAWPAEWDISFRLHAPRETIVECRVIAGKVDRVEVTPRSRARDLVVHDPQ